MGSTFLQFATPVFCRHFRLKTCDYSIAITYNYYRYELTLITVKLTAYIIGNLNVYRFSINTCTHAITYCPPKLDYVR